MTAPTKITSLTVRDIRFPTTLTKAGSDAIHSPDYSCAYVTLTTDCPVKGYGLTFTCGRGTDVVCLAIKSYSHLVVDKHLNEIFEDFASFWNEMTQETQLRWLGPQKGVIHLAVGAIMNAIWDLWSKVEEKPLWKLLVDMEPEKLLSVIDFSYITDALSKDEALEILKKGQEGKKEREADVLAKGITAYITSVGWMGYSDEKVIQLCKEALADGFKSFKAKVGISLEEDMTRLALLRREIGEDSKLMVDANQIWDVDQAIEWVTSLAKFNLTWIEEPTSPDDILGHAKIAKALKPLGIGVATGEHCQNRIMFKQFLQANALQFCQIDSCRLAGPSEIISVLLMAAKFGVPVCPHAGGVGLCEMVQHLAIFDYLCISKTREDRVLEYVDHLHEHFVHPVIVKNGSYQAPTKPGYCTEMKADSLDDYEYPRGSRWQKLFAGGLFK